MEGQIYHRNFIHRSNCLFVIIFGSWLLGLLSLVSAVPAAGQTITPDGTAGTAINLNGATYSITGGTVAGSNLLHSFDKFGLNTGFVADFQDPGAGAIDNIIGRVTGGELSSIDGTLRAFTNLYLINPAGMIFGPNATLDVNGSFHASTADRVVFSNNSYYSVADLGGSTFSMAAPERFGFLGGDTGPAGITVNESILTVPAGERIALVGGDIAVEGGIFGFFEASDGRIDLVSVASAGEFDLTAASAPVADFSALGTVDLSNFAFLDVSGDGGGRIVIRGGEIRIQQSSLFADTFGFTSGAGIDIEARGNANFGPGTRVLARNASFFATPSGIEVNAANIILTDDAQFITDTFGPLPGGNIQMTASDTFAIQNDFAVAFGIGGLFSDSFGDGPSGNITVTAATATMNEGQISAFPNATGPGGKITFNAEDVQFRFGAVILGDSVEINATGSTLIFGTDFFGFRNFIQSTGGNGIAFDAPTLQIDDAFMIASNGGIGLISTNLTIEDSLLASPGGFQIDTTNFTLGNGGALTSIVDGTTDGNNIVINATNSLTLDGAGGPSRPSIAASALGTGTAGEVTLNAPTININNGVVQNSGSDGLGAGVINITGDNVTLTGSAQIEGSSTGSAPGANIFVSATNSFIMRTDEATGDPLIQSSAFSVGPGGAISIQAPIVTIEDGIVAAVSTSASITATGGTVDVNATSFSITNGTLSVGTSGAANAGSVNVNAGSVLVGPNAQINSSTFGTGLGGIINVTADSVTVRGGGSVPSFIVSATSGLADAGSVNLNVGNLTLEAGGGIQTSALLSGTASGGTININASERVLLTGADAGGAPSSIGSFGVFGPSGSINITTPELILLDDSSIEASNTSGAGGEINLDLGRLEIGTDSAISAFTDGPATGGRIFINATNDISIGDGGGIVAFTSGAGPGGVIELQSAVLNLSGGVVTSRSTETGGDAGQVIIMTDQLNMTNGGKIDAATLGDGLGGMIEVTVAGNALIIGTNENSSPSSIQSNAEGSGAGGSITFSATNATISGGGVISSTSTGTGDAGNILVNVSNDLTMGSGAITTEAIEADGGNIVIQVTNIAFFTNSQITSSVGTGDGGGGNIFIDPVFVILKGSQIQANAFGGPGGNILIVAENFLASPDSIIEASSQLGIDGIVQIDAPDTDASSALAVLPAGLMNAAAQLAAQCSARGGRTLASFVGTGRGGLPAGPGELIPSFYSAGKLRAISGSNAAADSPGRAIRIANIGNPEMAQFIAAADRMKQSASGGPGPVIVPATMVLSCAT